MNKISSARLRRLWIAPHIQTDLWTIESVRILIIFMIPLKVHPHIHNYFKVDSVLIIAKLRKHICTHLIYTHTDILVCTVGIYWKGQQTKEPTIKKRFTRTNHGIGSLRSDRIGPMRAFENVTLLFHGHCQWIECDCLFVVVHNAWNID